MCMLLFEDHWLDAKSWHQAIPLRHHWVSQWKMQSKARPIFSDRPKMQLWPKHNSRISNIQKQNTKYKRNLPKRSSWQYFTNWSAPQFAIEPGGPVSPKQHKINLEKQIDAPAVIPQIKHYYQCTIWCQITKPAFKPVAKEQRQPN